MDASALARTIELAQRRDPQALATLFDGYADRVFGLLYRRVGDRDTAEELMQETFLRMVRMIDQYQEGGRFEAWLFRIAANLARDHARQRARRGTPASLAGNDDETPLDPPDRTAEPPLGDLLADERRAAVAAALDELPDAEREILLLRHYSELPFRDIAELLGVPLGTALARAHRALKRLRGVLEHAGVRDDD